MSKIQNYGIHDPNIETELTEDEKWIEDQIVYNGELTCYGQTMYDQSKEQFYDEEDERWIEL